MEADQGAPGGPNPSDGEGKRGMIYLVITVALCLGPAVFGYWWWIDAQRVELIYNGVPIAQPEQLLASADGEFQRTLSADGAEVFDGAGCFFAPGFSGAMIVCGPVWLGVSPADEPWLELRTNYSVEEGFAYGELVGFDGTTGVDLGTLSHPGGRRPAQPLPQPIYPSSGLRLSNGIRLIDPGSIIDQADAAFNELAMAGSDELAGVAVAEDASCFFLQNSSTIGGKPTVADKVYCGPGRSVASRWDEVWVPVNLKLGRGPEFGAAIYQSIDVWSSRLRTLRDDETLWRPDGLVGPDPGTVNRPPVAADFAAVIDWNLDDAVGGSSGVLATEDYRIEFESLQRVDTIGSGGASFTASDGYDLIIASVAPSENTIAPRGTLEIDGVAKGLPNWRSREKGATLIVSVPESASSVTMTIENDGRPQTISLLDGKLGDGFPVGLYREPVQVAAPVSMRVEMPVGESVLVSGTIAEVVWSARDLEGDWLPLGQARLTVVYDGWDVDRPCCDVSIDETFFTSRLLVPSVDQPSDQEVTSTDTTDTTVPEEQSPSEAPPPTTFAESATVVVEDARTNDEHRSRFRNPTFIVADNIEQATYELGLVVEFTVDGEAYSQTSTFELPLVLP